MSKSLIISVALILVAAGAAYWFFVLKQTLEEPATTTTFTPRPSVALDPLKTLKNLFSLNNQTNLPDSASLLDLTPIHSAISAAVTDNQAKNVFITPKNEAGETIKFSEFAKRFLSNQAEPGSNSETLASSIYDENFGLVSSLQEEKFDSKGKLLLNAPAERRLALTVEISDLTGAQSILNAWEQNLPSDIKGLFELDLKANNYAFQDNTYREVPIRFVNFPNPDRSIDYAFVKSINSRQYLVVSSSRAQMYGIIDTLLGF